MQHRKLILVIGAMRSGKSFFSDEYLKSYNRAGGAGLVYNLGRKTDFKTANQIELLNFKQHSALSPNPKQFKQNPSFKYYKDEKEKQQDFKNFSINFAGRSAKAYKLGRNFEREFVDSFYFNCSNTLLVLDDARAIFRYGMNDNYLNLFSRINHTGRHSPAKNWRDKGSDIIIIFHSLDHVNLEILDYCTHIVCFKYAFEPDFKRLDNKEIREQLKTSFRALNQAPKYYYTITDVHNVKTLLYKPIKI